MDPLLNPFAPGAGTPPPKLAGREEVLKKTEITLGRVKAGKPAKSFIVVGLRGVGKTVLLGEVYSKAESLNYCAVQIEAHENKALAALLLPKLRQVLLKLDKIEKAREVGNAALRVLAAFATAVRASVGEVEFSLSVDPDRGSADSGDLEVDLPDLLEAVGKAAKAKETAVALIIDEMQYLSETEMSALIMAAHRMQQRQLPVVLVGGGLPQILALAGRSKSYAERLFDYPRVGALEEVDAREALAEPIQCEGMDITEAAVREVIARTEGYPYFLQTWGHFCWDVCQTDSIELEDVKRATEKALDNLDESFFRVRFDRLTTAEKDYLFAMADLGPGPHRSGDVAAQMKRKVESVAPTRSSLMKKGMVFSPSHGDTAFTVPMFDTYLRRVRD
ncbi:MAG: ATP-binding protein [Rhodospirillum sp.]|nr:ATP-binding protein [Rhodospirillum sp.]MCF8488271.1 ATP-binding protein [Rhodospirillum sp.]MCF8500073.1 ATP-binding protein [Rhodospirillum sp.]